MARMTAPAMTAPVPQTDDDARRQIRELGDAQRELTRLKTQLDDKIAKLKQQFGEKSDPLKATVKQLTKGLRTYCESHRDRLTDGGKVKSHNFTTGVVSWRHRPPSVKISGDQDALIADLFRADLGQFVETSHKISREAILKDPEAVAKFSAISVGSAGEQFAIEPHETELAES